MSPTRCRPASSGTCTLHELEAHPISLKLMVRARGGLDTFPSLVVEELRKAMPQLGSAAPA